MNRSASRISLIGGLLVSACGASDPPSGTMTSTTATSGSTTTGTTTSSTGTSTTGGQAGNGGSTGTGSSMNDASSAGGSGGSPGMEAGKEGSADGRGNWTVGDPGIEGDGDVTLEPNPPEHPDIATKNVPHGKSFQFTMSSADSQIYKGDDATLQSRRAFTRRVTVYVPSQYVDGTEAPFMVVQDERDQNEIKNSLDNLIPTKKLPVFIALFVASGGGDSKGSQRGLEYDTMSDRYSRFVDAEVLPAVKNNAAVKAAYPGLKFTENPEGRASYGCSSGGAAAMTQAWFTPDRFRRIVGYSATLVDQQDDDAAEEKMFPFGAWEYHSGLNLIANNPVKPIRVFIHAGQSDNGAGTGDAGHHDWLLANQRTAAALKAKGYHYRFLYAKGAGGNGGGHCDGKATKASIPDTLTWLWQGYPR